MKAWRSREKITELTTGPGKLTQGLGIDLAFDGMDLTVPDSVLSIVDDGFVAKGVVTAKRIGISKAVENLYRFYLAGSNFISKK